MYTGRLKTCRYFRNDSKLQFFWLVTADQHVTHSWGDPKNQRPRSSP